jgi:hypothetical protein
VRRPLAAVALGGMSVTIFRVARVLAAAAVLSLTACGSTPVAGTAQTAVSTAAATSTSIVTSSPASSTSNASGLQTYESTQEIVDSLEAGGVKCTGLKNDDAPSIAVQQSRCKYLGKEIVVAIYTSTQERIQAVDTITELLASAGIDYGVVSGGNWMVNCGNTMTCSTFRTPLGGKVTAG